VKRRFAKVGAHLAGVCLAGAAPLVSLSAGAAPPPFVPSDALDASSLPELGADLRSRTSTWIEVHGDLRARGELLGNLDLDRGTTPSGQPLFAVPLGDPKAQWLTSADMRLRTDVALFAPGGHVAVRMRLDFLDNHALGSAPVGPVVAATSQAPPSSPATLRRAYAEVLAPFGVVAVGRMGSQWGLGLLSASGDHPDSDAGDAADRIAVVSPLFGHVLAVAYDFAAIGAQAPHPANGRWLDRTPQDDVRTVTFAALHYTPHQALMRRRAVGRSTLDYGGYASYRWQDVDFPGGSASRTATRATQATHATQAAQAVQRGLQAVAGDLWLRLDTPRWLLQAEAAVLSSRIAEPTLLPGALYRQPVEGLQWGGEVQARFRPHDAGLGVGLDFGVASGDPDPGFSGAPERNLGPTQAGELHGAQVDLPRDRRADDFRFHPDHRVDRILFREIVGTVTDAAWVKPQVRWLVQDFGAGSLTLALQAVASMALYAESTPGGRHPLGIEIEPGLDYRTRDGFGFALHHAVLFPLAGLDNPAQGLSARPAQLLQVRLHQRF